MGLFCKLSDESVTALRPVVVKQEKILARETVKLGIAPPKMEVANPELEIVSHGENAKMLRHLVSHAKDRVDHVLVTKVATPAGIVHIAVPLSGNDALAAEFSCDLPVGSPSALVLTRSYGSGVWKIAEPNALPEAVALVETLKKVDSFTDGIEWSIKLPGNYSIKLSWAFQIVPISTKCTRLFMQTGQLGILNKRLGLHSFLNKRDILTRLLGQVPENSKISLRAPPHPSFIEALSQL